MKYITLTAALAHQENLPGAINQGRIFLTLQFSHFVDCANFGNFFNRFAEFYFCKFINFDHCVSVVASQGCVTLGVNAFNCLFRVLHDLRHLWVIDRARGHFSLIFSSFERLRVNHIVHCMIARCNVFLHHQSMRFDFSNQNGPVFYKNALQACVRLRPQIRKLVGFDSRTGVTAFPATLLLSAATFTISLFPLVSYYGVWNRKTSIEQHVGFFKQIAYIWTRRYCYC